MIIKTKNIDAVDASFVLRTISKYFVRIISKISESVIVNEVTNALMLFDALKTFAIQTPV